MVEDADPRLVRIKELGTDLAETINAIRDYQTDLDRLCAPDRNRVRTTPIFDKYDVPQIAARFNNWPGAR